MSPAVTRKRRAKGEPIELKAKDYGGDSSRPVTVEPLLDTKEVTVTWICGGARTFNVEDLRRAIEYFDGPLGQKHKAWLYLRDSDGAKFYIHAEDGKLTANESTTENGTISWAMLKRALRTAIAEVLDPESPPA